MKITSPVKYPWRQWQLSKRRQYIDRNCRIFILLFVLIHGTVSGTPGNASLLHEKTAFNYGSSSLSVQWLTEQRDCFEYFYAPKNSSPEATESRLANHEVSIGHALLPLGLVFEVAKYVGVGIASLGTVDEELSTSGQFLIGYRYRPRKHIMWGGDFAFEQYKTTYSRNGEYIAHTDSRYVTFAAAYTYAWIHRPVIQVYSGLGAGMIFLQHIYEGEDQRDPQSAMSIAFQLNLLGLKVGKRLYGFTELGFGYRGLGTIGLAYQF